MTDNLPDIKPIEAKGAAIYKRISDLSIKTPEDFKLLCALLTEVKRVAGLIRSEFEGPIESAHRSHKQILGLRDKALAVLDESECLGKAKAVNYKMASGESESLGSDSVYFVERWTYEVVNESEVKENYRAIDHNKIRGVVMALGQEAEKVVGGIRVFKNVTVAVRA